MSGLPTTAEQRSVAGTLGSIATLAAAASIGPPATLIVGDVAALAGLRQPADIVVGLPR